MIGSPQRGVEGPRWTGRPLRRGMTVSSHRTDMSRGSSFYRPTSTDITTGAGRTDRGSRSCPFPHWTGHRGHGWISTFVTRRTDGTVRQSCSFSIISHGTGLRLEGGITALSTHFTESTATLSPNGISPRTTGNDTVLSDVGTHITSWTDRAGGLTTTTERSSRTGHLLIATWRWTRLPRRTGATAGGTSR